jgi:hypothetical protein
MMHSLRLLLQRVEQPSYFSQPQKSSKKWGGHSPRVRYSSTPWNLSSRSPFHSVRNARIGSIRDALHAGTTHARAATASSVAATAAKIAGSSGRVP